MKLKLLLVLSAAFIFRLIALNQSLWLDEATTANVVKNYSYLEITTKFSPHDFHPPLYYLVLKFWTSIFGYSEVALRFPSVIFSIITGWVIYLIGKKIKNEGAGIWSAVFFLFNPLIIYYSQEARMYMMTTFFLTLVIYSFLFIEKARYHVSHSVSVLASLRTSQVVRNGYPRFLIMFNFAIFLSFLTFYGSIFIIFAFYIYLIYKKRFNLLIETIPGFLLALLLVLPLLQQQLINAKQSLSLVANWSLVLGKASLKNLLLIPLKFSIGRISFYPKWLYWGVSSLWAIWIFWNVIRGGLKNKLLLYLFICPLFIGLLLSLFTPLLQYFRFLYLIPIISLLLSLGMNLSIKRSIIAVGFLIWSLSYLLIPQFHREDWKSLVKNIPSDTVYMISSSSDPTKYYRPEMMIKDLKEVDIKNPLKKQIMVIPYTAEIHGLNYQKILEDFGYFLQAKKNFRELYYEIWLKKNLM